MKIEELIQQASELSESERVRLAEHVLATLDGPPDADAAEAWAAEVQRRSREIEEGRVQPIPWTEVKSAARRSRG